MTERNVVPRQAPHVADVAELAGRLGWKPDKKFNKESDRYETGEYAWKVGSRDRVVLAQNQAVEHAYLVVEAPDPADLVAVLLGNFPSWTDEEIRTAVRDADSPDDLVDAFHLVGARAFETHEAELSRAIERGTVHENAQVRLAATLAASRLRWPELKAVVQNVAEHDPEQVIRDVTSSYLGRQVWNRS